jgi:hypothetical protein
VGKGLKILAKPDMGSVLKSTWSLTGNISFINDDEKLFKISRICCLAKLIPGKEQHKDKGIPFVQGDVVFIHFVLYGRFKQNVYLDINEITGGSHD